MTGATGFIGAHVVDQLLSRGMKVRGATRSLLKGKAMIDARPEFREKLDFVQVDDFENPGGFEEAIQDVDAVIHVASVRAMKDLNNITEILTLPSLSRMTPRTMRRSWLHQRSTVLTLSSKRRLPH